MATNKKLEQRHNTDVVIIGAGPVALFAAFECGHLGLSCHLIDSMSSAGGQCLELYPEKPIFDVPGIPVCTGQELVDGLLKQSAPFKPTFHFDEQATALEQLDTGRWSVTTSSDSVVCAAAIVIAAGVGSFEPRRLRISNADAFDGQSLFYAVRDREKFRDRNVLISGGGDSALDWVLELAPIAKKITLVHRRRDFRAAPNTVSQVLQLVDDGVVDLLVGAPTQLVGDSGQLSSVAIRTKTDLVEVDCNAMLVFYGLSPNLGPIMKWGLNLERNQIPVNTENFETQISGIFAIGDICTYPGKLKLLLSGFHEGALMAQKAFSYANPDKPLVFRHTTSNTELQHILGAA